MPCQSLDPIDDILPVSVQEVVPCGGCLDVEFLCVQCDAERWLGNTNPIHIINPTKQKKREIVIINKLVRRNNAK